MRFLLKNAYRGYRGMLFFAPDLKEAHLKDPPTLISFYVAFYLKRPLESTDPFIAAHYVRCMLNDPKGAGGYLLDHGPEGFIWHALWRLIHSREALEECLLGST